MGSRVGRGFEANVGYSLQELIGYVSLTGTIMQVKEGIPNPLPPAMLQGTGKTIGDQGRYTVMYGQRQTSRLAQYGSPAVRRPFKNMAIRDVKLIHTFEEQAVDPIAVQNLRQFDNYEVQKMGLETVKWQLQQFVRLFQNLRIAATGMVLANGTLWFDGSGNLLPSSSGAVETISFGISSNNQNQLNGIISQGWDNPSTDIPGQLRALKKQALELTGYELTTMFYGKNIPSYLAVNDYVHDFLAREGKMDEEYLKDGEIPQGLFGFKWIPSYKMFWEDNSNTNQSIFGDDSFTATPDVSAEWWQFLEGSYPVPTTVNIVADAVAAVQSLKQVWGMFGYGMVSTNPVGLSTFYGDTFLPVLANPDAIYQAVVAGF